MKDEIKEIKLSELLETDFTINENMEMVGIFTLDRINMISDILTNLQEENERLKTTQIFIDTQDPEERCGQALYEEMLKRDCENYKQRIDKATNYILENICCDTRVYTKNQNIYKVVDILRGDE